MREDGRAVRTLDDDGARPAAQKHHVYETTDAHGNSSATTRTSAPRRRARRAEGELRRHPIPPPRSGIRRTARRRLRLYSLDRPAPAASGAPGRFPAARRARQADYGAYAAAHDDATSQQEPGRRKGTAARFITTRTACRRRPRSLARACWSYAHDCL